MCSKGCEHVSTHLSREGQPLVLITGYDYQSESHKPTIVDVEVNGNPH